MKYARFELVTRNTPKIAQQVNDEYTLPTNIHFDQLEARRRLRDYGGLVNLPDFYGDGSGSLAEKPFEELLSIIDTHSLNINLEVSRAVDDAVNIIKTYVSTLAKETAYLRLENYKLRLEIERINSKLSKLL